MHFFFIVCTKELYGFVDFRHDACWCERARPKRQPSGGWCSQTGEATARALGSGFLGCEHARWDVSMQLTWRTRVGSVLNCSADHAELSRRHLVGLQNGKGWLGLGSHPQVLEGNFFLASSSRLSFTDTSGGCEVVF